ncbi:hypothetical protein MMC16_004193 [Acarospora aff. strigata]|nr:hypothetical protein [Acarospora aff. strigata]
MADRAEADNKPEFRARVDYDPRAPSHTNLFEVGQMVYTKRGRALHGPYRVDAVRTDGTYRLTDNGMLYNDSAREEDLRAA